MLIPFEFIRVGQSTTRFSVKGKVAKELNHNIVVHTITNSDERNQEFFA